MPQIDNRIAAIRVALAVSTMLAAPAAYAQSAAAPQAAAAPGSDAIVVTGFRRSLEAALNIKKSSVSSVDAIVAEDIAKFPDQNLAESLQRIPGIAIQRDGGEGRSITVRGLGSQFTRVRVNGLEAITTTSDGASANRGRSFDFNVFASELFSNLVVHKTAEASLDEGSLGAVVDLNTGNPLAAKRGLSGVLSAIGSYNDLSNTVSPRLAGLVNWRNEASTLGASFSAAYSKSRTVELGNNSVRWAQARFDSVNGTPCFYSSATSTTGVANTGGVYTAGRVAACDTAALSFHPRIPRYGVVTHNRERLGLTGSIQWAPTSATKVSIDGLYSRFKDTRDEQWLEVLFRSNERAIDVVNPVYDNKGNMVSGTFNDAYVRTENFHREPTTTFKQLGLTWDQKVTDKLRFTLLGGMSKSDANVPVESTIMLDNKAAQGFSYDYTNMASPKISFGTSVTDPANFQLSEIRDAPSDTINQFKTLQLRTEWDVAEGFKISAGAMWRRYNFDLTAGSRNTTVCGNGGTSLVTSTAGTVTCSATSAIAAGSVYGFPVTSALTQMVDLGNAGQASGTTTQWIVANLPAAAAFTGLYNRPVVTDVTNVRGVQETTKGGYLQFDGKGNVLGLDYALNFGTRYVKTEQMSYGLVTSGTATNRAEVSRSYDDWLPAANLVIYPTRNLVIRGAVAKAITRPALDQLTPGGSADGFNYTVKFGNPQLDPYRSTNYDVSVEWYLARGAILSVALFKKDIASFPVASNISNATFTQTGLPSSVLLPSSPAAIDPTKQSQAIWTISTTVSGSGASLKGAEVAVQLPFKMFTDGFFSRFGLLANATFVDSNAQYSVQGPATAPGGGLATQTVLATLLNLSKEAYNGTLYYEDAKFSARASLAYRSGYNDGVSGTGNIFEGYGPTTNLDASMRYKLTKDLELSVEGNNLLDTYRYRFTDATVQRNYENNHFGRTIMFGARWKH